MILKRPVVPSMVSPPAAEIESVQPGNGYSREHAMIEGLHITHLILPIFLTNDFSARFLVKVYVFGNTPSNYFKFD